MIRTITENCGLYLLSRLRSDFPNEGSALNVNRALGAGSRRFLRGFWLLNRK